MKRALLVVFAVLVLVAAVVAYAQYPPQPGEPGAIRPMGPPLSPAITASGDYVFVLRGNEVLKLRASDLTLVTARALPKPKLPEPPPEH